MGDPASAEMPTTLADYIRGVVTALPEGSVRDALKAIRIFSPAEAEPKRKETLFNWTRMAKGFQEGNLRLTLILGETDSEFRVRRSDAPSSPKMTMARTCDGVAGAEAILGLLRAYAVGLSTVDFAGVVDEWSKLDGRLADSHLLVMGSPEVNACATFLHGLIRKFHFGNRYWPPQVSWTGRTFHVDGRSYDRNSENRLFHDGGVFLLRNPWNPEYRLLWIAGVSGRGTCFGASLIADNWRDHKDAASKSTGVIFRREFRDERPVSEQFMWLSHGGIWRGVLDELPPSKLRQMFDVFLSHNSKDRLAVCTLKGLVELNSPHVRVWYDKEQLQPGMPWPHLLEQGIELSTSIAVLVGKDGIGPWQDEEIWAALTLAVKEKRAVIPVLLPGAPSQPELPEFLKSRTWVDFRNGFTEEGIANLVWGITGKKP